MGSSRGDTPARASICFPAPAITSAHCHTTCSISLANSQSLRSRPIGVSSVMLIWGGLYWHIGEEEVYIALCSCSEGFSPGPVPVLVGCTRIFTCSPAIISFGCLHSMRETAVLMETCVLWSSLRPASATQRPTMPHSLPCSVTRPLAPCLLGNEPIRELMITVPGNTGLLSSTLGLTPAFISHHTYPAGRNGGLAHRAALSPTAAKVSVSPRQPGLERGTSRPQEWELKAP